MEQIKTRIASEAPTQALVVPANFSKVVIADADLLIRLCQEEPANLRAAVAFFSDVGMVVPDTVTPEAGKALKDVDAFKNAAVTNELTTTIRTAACEIALANAQGRLKNENKLSWQASHAISQALATLIFKNLPALSAMIKWDSDPIKALVHKTTWLDYRLTAQSSATLCKTAVSIVAPHEKMLFTDHELAKVVASKPYDLDSGIPSTAIAKSAIILEAFEVNTGKWYQGTKARATFPTLAALKIKQVLKVVKARLVSEEYLQTLGSDVDVMAAARITDVAVARDDNNVVNFREQSADTVARKILKDQGVDVPKIPEGMSMHDLQRAIVRGHELATAVQLAGVRPVQAA